jgi:hypothetical protein
MKLAATALALACANAAACPVSAQDGDALTDGSVTLAWRALPRDIVVGRPFAMQVMLCPADAQLSGVDATMPEHRHGMNYKPSLKPMGGGRWRAEGLLWHMSGRWELRFDVLHAGVKHSVTRDVSLP